MNANALSTNLIVTGIVLLMVFVLPWLDRKLCKKLGLNLTGGVSANPEADRLLRIRSALLLTAFGVYVLAVVWITVFSRTAAEGYKVYINLFGSLMEFIHSVFTKGFGASSSQVKIQWSGFTQVYMNLMLFVPMGYLLPYLFTWFRKRVYYRPAAACFVISLLIENIQLITRRGFYDADDLASNTLGGIVGQFLFVGVAYVVTNPNWRKDLQSYRRWKRNASSRTLYPFARKMDLSRTTLLASNEETIWDFYVMKLGFRLKKQIVPLDSDGTDMLLEMGRLQVEVHCLNAPGEFPAQSLTLSARRLKPILQRLEQNGIAVSPVEQDPYTGLRCIRFDGPDGVRITIIEA